MHEFVHEVGALHEAALNLEKRVSSLIERPL
jgi:ubiquinone biosynthesis protein UbiJ